MDIFEWGPIGGLVSLNGLLLFILRSVCTHKRHSTGQMIHCHRLVILQKIFVPNFWRKISCLQDFRFFVVINLDVERATSFACFAGASNRLSCQLNVTPRCSRDRWIVVRVFQRQTKKGRERVIFGKFENPTKQILVHFPCLHSKVNPPFGLHLSKGHTRNPGNEEL